MDTQGIFPFAHIQMEGAAQLTFHFCSSVPVRHTNLYLSFCFTTLIFIWETRLGDDRIPDRGGILIHIITENRLRHASGPIQAQTLIPLHTQTINYVILFLNILPASKLSLHYQISFPSLAVHQYRRPCEFMCTTFCCHLSAKLPFTANLMFSCYVNLIFSYCHFNVSF